MYGESLDRPDYSQFIEEVLTPLMEEYEPQNIFNADETSLFYKLLSNHTRDGWQVLWLTDWNNNLIKQSHHVLLLIDNTPGHVIGKYSNIRIQFLPFYLECCG